MAIIHFEIKRAGRGRLRRPQWVAAIVGANGRTLFTSETYNNRGDAASTAQLVIDSIQGGTYTIDVGDGDVGGDVEGAS